jgi:hypothetical protein
VARDETKSKKERLEAIKPTTVNFNRNTYHHHRNGEHHRGDKKAIG